MGWMTSVSRTNSCTGPRHGWNDLREVVADEKGRRKLQGVVTDYRRINGSPFICMAPITSSMWNTGWRRSKGDAFDADGRRALQVLSVADEHRDGPVFKKKMLEQARREFATLKELCERGLTTDT